MIAPFIHHIPMRRFIVIRSSFVVILLVLFVVGLFILFRSVGWGTEAANDYLRSQGGGMDTTQFTIILQEYITTYRWIGSILSIIGGLGLVRAVEL
jgi:hypothetical protein